MTREEIEKFIKTTEGLFGLSNGVHPQRLADLVALAKLGASVAAPRDDEIEKLKHAMVVAFWTADFPSKNDDVISLPVELLDAIARAALSALRESKP